MIMSCMDCLSELTIEERRYYMYRCESCERKEHGRIVKWRNGVKDKELDKKFSIKKPIAH